MAKLSLIARIACLCAFVLAILTLVSGFFGSIMNIPLALIPLIAGVGILRGHAWSAYGLALYSFAQVLLLPLILTRPGNQDLSPQLILSTVLALLISLLFLFAGRSLVASGSASGNATPWIILTALVTLPQLFVRPFVIPTGSMENTMLIGDRILVQTLPKPAPERGDLVTFVYPIDVKSTNVKRIVGIPGDRIRISKKVLYRNGVVVNETYAAHKSEYDDAFRDNFPSQPPTIVPPRGLDMLSMHVQKGEVIVPIGQYFVMGDNRDLSLDSRYWGFISASEIIGKPFLIYDSEDPKTGRRWNRLFHRL